MLHSDSLRRFARRRGRGRLALRTFIERRIVEQLALRSARLELAGADTARNRSGLTAEDATEKRAAIPFNPESSPLRKTGKF